MWQQWCISTLCLLPKFNVKKLPNPCSREHSPSTARLTHSALMPHSWFLPRCCIHLLGVFNSLVWLFPHSSDQPSCGCCIRSPSKGEGMELYQRQGLTLTLDENDGLFCHKPCSKQAVLLCAPRHLLSCRQPEKQNFNPRTALEFRQLNYLNFLKLLESLWKARLFYHLSLAGMTSWWLLLSFWKAVSIELKKD